MIRRLSGLMAALLFVDFVDELSAGMPTIGVPGIEGDFGLTYTSAAFFVFTLPILVSLFLEPPLFLLADRHPKKYFVVGGLLAMAACDFVVGIADEFVLVATALALSGTASGCGVSLSQAALMDTYPEDRPQLMVRWTLMGSLGDLAAPALFWVLAAFALGWREAFVATGVLIMGYALVLALTDFEPRGRASSAKAADEEPKPSFREVLVAGFRNRRLMIWLGGVWLCSLLDEVLVAFGALWMREQFGADQATRSALLMSLMLGATLGLLALDRLTKRTDPVLLLKIAGPCCAVSYAAWLASDTAWQSAICLFAVGLFSSALYPIAKAQAYQALPGRSGMVNAVSHVFTPLDLVLPLFLGLIADRFGLEYALAALVLQPVGLAAIAFSGIASAPDAESEMLT